MRIDDLNRAPLSQNTPAQGAAGTPASEKTGTADRAHGSSSGSAGVSEGADRADVSNLAHSLAGPDPARIEQLRVQVESGTYEVSAQSVAHALIEAHLDTQS